jgi:hypothetical protein
MLENTIDSDLFCGLAYTISSGQFSEALYRTDTTAGPPYPGLTFLAPIRPTPTFDFPGLPGDLRNVFYFHNVYSPTFRSYLGFYDEVRREYRYFSWDNEFDPPRLRVITTIDRRIDHVFSNDTLFGTEGNKGYVYDGNGELINSFVKGGLDLVYEMADSGLVNRVVFTIPVWAPVQVDNNYWEDKLFFIVYWIPTEQLADL